MVFAIAAMIVWLILDHHLWERPVDPRARERAVLYNTSTVFTLLVGVLRMYAGLFAISLVAAGFMIDNNYFQQNLRHPVGWSDYLQVAWFASSLAVVAGALGSGFESEESVRQAAYSYRERERRASLGDDDSTTTDEEKPDRP